MKLFLTFVSTFAIALAEAPQGGYGGGGGASPFSGGGGFNFGSGGYTTGGNIGGFGSGGGPAPGGFPAPGAPAQEEQGPQVFKYVSIHAAPEDPEDSQTRTVRVPGGKDKHVNIIFVKAPSNGADQKTEVVLPEADEHKNLVYVLVQKTDPTANLQIRRPEPTKPSKPEVYFIRYKNPGQEQGQNGEAGGAGGYSNGGAPSAVPSAAYGSPSPSYGSPSPAYGAP